MTPFAADGDVKFVAGRHDRPGTGGELAGLKTGPVVQSKDGIYGKPGEQAVLDHLAGTTTALLGGLKNQVDRAIKMAMCAEVLRRSQQHGGVAVMATGVHLASLLAGVTKGIGLLHGQGVHVGAKTHSPGGAAIFQNTDHTGGAQATVDGNAPFGELGRHQICRAHLLEAEFRVGMDVAAQGGKVVALAHDGVDQVHGCSAGIVVSLN
jgi:hypothetical protein